MALNGIERSNYISFLRDNTQYTYSYIRTLDDDRLYHMYVRISQAIPQYITEILAKVEEPGYVGRKYTRLELTKYTYNELADIRKSLGIRKGRKKVVKVEPAPQETIQKAQEEFHQMTLEELYGQINNSNLSESEHEEFLDEKELHQAYGEDVPSEPELKAKGIINLDANEKRFREIIRQRIVIKKAILQVIRKINRQNPILLHLSMKEIEALDFQELIEEYRKLQDIIPTIPKIEDIKEKEQSKLGK